MGRAYVEVAQAQRALQHYNEALVLQRAVGDRLGEGITLNQIGIAYSVLDENQKALEFHQQSLDLTRAVGNRREEGIALDNLGRVSRILGQPRIALDYHNQAIRIFRGIGDRQHEATALYGLARTESDFGNYSQAGHYLTAALSLFEDVRANVGAEQLRAAYLASKQDAYKFYIGLLMRMHALEPTKSYDALALQTSERARARSLLEMLAEARADIRQGVDMALLERERKLMQQLNAKAQRQLQLLGQKDSQERLSELNKQISALEDEYRLVQATIRKSSPAYAALTQPQPLGLKEIQQQLDPNTLLLEYALGDQRSYLWAVSANSFKAFDLPRRELIRKSARRVYELLTARSASKAGETASQKQDRLAQADLELLAASQELSAMVLGPIASELGNKRLVVVADDALQYVPFAALSVVSSPLSVVSRATSSALGPSHNEPPTTDNGPRTTDKFRPLILDHEIISLPSASALAVLRKNLFGRKPAAKAVAVIADPVFSIADDRLNADVRSLGRKETQRDGSASTRILEHLVDDSTGGLAIRRLRFTRQEADQILAVAPRKTNLRALDFKASRAMATSAELSQYRYVHFATHGYLDSERAELSAVVLSLVDEQGKPEDGFLRAHEIYNLKLPAELVVLSACQTGLGKEVKGEGLVGLTRGFMYAGARRVVVSLWNVNDRATAELMQRFYRGMLREKLTPAASLRRAQSEMSRHPQWQSPYYWAAFVIQGEWR
jgi:CHAT domain-containing protein